MFSVIDFTIVKKNKKLKVVTMRLTKLEDNVLLGSLEMRLRICGASKDFGIY